MKSHTADRHAAAALAAMPTSSSSSSSSRSALGPPPPMRTQPQPQKLGFFDVLPTDGQPDASDDDSVSVPASPQRASSSFTFPSSPLRRVPSSSSSSARPAAVPLPLPRGS